MRASAPRDGRGKSRTKRTGRLLPLPGTCAPAIAHRRINQLRDRRRSSSELSVRESCESCRTALWKEAVNPHVILCHRRVQQGTLQRILAAARRAASDKFKVNQRDEVDNLPYRAHRCLDPLASPRWSTQRRTTPTRRSTRPEGRPRLAALASSTSTSQTPTRGTGSRTSSCTGQNGTARGLRARRTRNRLTRRRSLVRFASSSRPGG